MAGLVGASAGEQGEVEMMGRLPDGWVFIPIIKNRIQIEIKKYELVTCKHCKHYKPYKGKVSGNTYFQCEVLDQNTEPDWFCADGEEEENGSDV